MSYNPYPLGKIPEHLMRPELQQLKELGYEWTDARDCISLFERKVASFMGAKYGVAVDCCSHGLFLCLKYLKAKGNVTIPKNTYCSVPQQIFYAGCTPVLKDIEWTGVYQLYPYAIYDAAVRWKRNAYKEFAGSLYVVSFQIKKILCIGKMGMVLTNSEHAYKALKLMSYDGRDLHTPYDSPEHLKSNGYHYYATPEDCARGIILMDSIKREGDSGGSDNYPDLTKWEHHWKEPKTTTDFDNLIHQISCFSEEMQNKIKEALPIQKPFIREIGREKIDE